MHRRGWPPDLSRWGLTRRRYLCHWRDADNWLRDPSHTRAVDPGAWTALCAANGLALERVWLSSLELEFDEWITRAHPAAADAARAREMLECAARGEIPGLHAWHAGGALRFTVGLQLVRAAKMS